MQHEQLTILSLADDPARFAAGVGTSFRQFGFAVVSDHDIPSELIARAWRLTAEFFALSETEKRRHVVAGSGGARGYTAFGIETAKGANAPDLKEFWHVGREPPVPGMASNVWPDRPVEFRDTFVALFAEFDRVGSIILDRIALHLGLAEDWFRPVVAGNNSVLRLLHYPPTSGAADGVVRAGAHEDINLITLLLGAEESGLELLTRGGEWLPVAPPEGTLVVNIGDMLQRLTNHVLPSTTHRVRNPAGERAGFSRYSMPYFLHPRSDFVIETLAECTSPGNPDRYPDPITADDYLQDRLREIGLKT
jgi:isopenicillin N synthase-like dioxygenase